MIVQCEDCKKVYDDAICWTICPHRKLKCTPSPQKILSLNPNHDSSTSEGDPLPQNLEISTGY